MQGSLFFLDAFLGKKIRTWFSASEGEALEEKTHIGDRSAVISA